MVRIWLEINSEIDSVALWRQIKVHKGINLTNLGQKVLVYGEVSTSSVGDIISKCCLYGDIQASIKR